ncbi:MAG: 3-dehydroquinate synthase, partial [Terrimicrobiaceae bacterium]|nr:3-dehydroquinate synthase [Terrimicrobiaceae bacterium]
MRISIELPGKGCLAHVGRGLLADCGPAIREACGNASSCALITDTTVGALYGAAVRGALEDAGARVVEHRVPDGENSKSLARTSEICEAMARGGLDRGSFVVALGGGVVGDLAGFAAAVSLRGIPCAQIPTTLLAQVDSSVGGKTGVNLACGKNLVGAFHQPRIVIADTATWDTLPERVFAEGLAEAIKHGAIRDPELALRARDLAAADPAAFV